MDIHEFYESDPRRRVSDEVTFGDGWTDRTDAHSTYRLKWVADTGELYTVREPHPGGILARYLDHLGLDQAGVADLRVEILAVAGRADVEAALTGWPEAMGRLDSLRWARSRLAEATRADTADQRAT